MPKGIALKTQKIIDAAYVVLQEIQPASVRAVCYKLFTLGVIPDMSKASTQKVSRALVLAREDGIIPWAWIVDETREVEQRSSWSDLGSFANTVRRAYRKDYWREQPYHVELWSEKGTVRGTLAEILDEFGIPFRVMHGFSSATVANSIAEYDARIEKPFVALYVGDFDPSGLHMSEVDLPGRLARYGGAIYVMRIALTVDDVTHGNLPYFESSSKISDPRHKWYIREYGALARGRCWELDAMSPVDLRERVRRQILTYIDADAWSRCLDIESAEFEALDAYADGLAKAGFGEVRHAR